MTERAESQTTIGPVPSIDREWVEHALEALARTGHQKGGARQAVLEALARHDCAVTALDLEEHLRGRDASVGRASIYRALEQLEELRLVHRLDVGHGRASYERAEPGGEHHHHLVCERCGRVAPFEDTGLERAVRRVSEDASFTVREHEIVLRGLCPRCS